MNCKERKYGLDDSRIIGEWRLLAYLCAATGDRRPVIAIELRQPPRRVRQQLVIVLTREFHVVEIGHVGDGGVYFNLVVPSETDGTVDTARVDALRSRAVSIAVEENMAAA